jgi:two-component system sporulation sensor kinase A
MQTKHIDQLRDAFFALDYNWCFTYLNPAAEQLLLRKKEELLGQSVWSEFKEALGSTFYEQYHKAVNQGIEVEFEEYYSPLMTWFDVRAYPIDGGLAVHFRDISLRKKALDESREHHRSLFEHHPDAVFSFDLEGNYLSINKRFEELLGYSEEEYLQMDYTPLVVPGELERTNYYFSQAVKGIPQNYETSCYRKDGQRIEVSVTNVPIIVDGSIVGVYGIAKDITKNKQRELDIKERESSLRSALRIARLGSWEWDLKTNRITWSEEMQRIVGWDVNNQGISYETYLSFVHPLDREEMDESIQKSLVGKPFNKQYRIMRPNGQIRYVEAIGESIFDEQGNAVKLIGTAQDVTERRIEQERLRRSEELYQLISENSQDIIMYIKPSGAIRYVSPAVHALMGYDPESLKGKVIHDFLHPDEVDNILKLKIENSEIFTARILHNDGHYVWIEASIKIIRGINGEIDKILAIGRDITERITAKELMIKSEKLTLAGQLAAGIAHEIRNPLTAIKGFLQLLEQGHNLQKDYFNIMGSELTRIEFILNELLLLAKPTKLMFAKVKVNAILSQVATLLETEAILKNVEIVTHLEGDLFINGDENQLKQVFINFVKNAIEAMPHGGTILIEMKEKSDFLLISITDQGSGIPEEKLEKIGQPFFTTKEKGTGLGLTVSFNIIENHNGEITFESEVDKGTTVKVKLPLVL